ncbi:MAG: hypothetical protein LUG14_02950 [Synergistaceae bacterium]|nr:hypothetical protein [Synergistaceae bacterium]
MRAEAARKRGFLLVELIAVQVIIGSLSCISIQTLSDSPARERRIIQNEAKNFCTWIKYRMAAAARESAEFRVMLTQNTDRSYEVTIIWLGGAKNLRHEIYSFDEAALAYEGVHELIFSGRWFTLAPSATFIVKSRKIPEVRYFVTISGTGYMDIKDKL